MDSDFENFENDDVIATVLAFKLLKKSKKQLGISCLSTNKRAKPSSAQTDQSQISFSAGFRHEIEHALYGTTKV